MKNTIIMVLGMHRSGTSSLARGLQCLDIDLGNDFLLTQKDNPLGFWEDKDLNAFQQNILDEYHFHWCDMRSFDSVCQKLMSNENKIQEAINLITRKVANYSVWAFKDPRTANFLPFWKFILATLDIQMKYIVSSRHPLSIAESIKYRNLLPVEMSIISWMRHTLNALLYSEKFPTCVVDYDLNLEDPKQQLSRVARDLSIPLPADFENKVEEYKKTFLTTSLRHSRFTDEDLNSSCVIPLAGKQLYQLLRELSFDQIDWASARVKAKNIFAELQNWDSIFNAFEKMHSQFKKSKEVIDILSEVNHNTRLMQQFLAC